MNKRFLSIEEYRRQHGLSYKTVNFLLDSGQLPYVKTEGGLRKIDTQPGNSTDNRELIERLDRQERAISALIRHLGVKI